MYPTNPFNPYPSVNPAYLNQINGGMHQPSNQIIKVNGRGGAEAYQMPPNSQTLLLDETEPIIWLKQTDGAGYPTLTAYDIKPHEEAPVPDMRNLEERIRKIEEAIKHEPDYSSDIRKDAGNRTSKTDGSGDKIIR